jgi:hypothetical protein
MKRKWAEVLFRQNEAMGYMPGDEAAHRAAAALGDRFDAPTLAAIGDALAFLERVGGQFHVVTLREKFNAAGERVEESELGEWQTAAMLIEYESRDARVILARPPEAVFEIPVTEFTEPPVEVDLGEDEPPEPDESERAVEDKLAPALTE